MPEMLSPGVYPRETDFSAFVRAQSTSIAGLVGVFERGAIGEAIEVTSLDEAKSKLGFANQGIVEGHFGMLSLRQFFENGGSHAFVVRAADGTEVKATATIEDREVTTPAPTLEVSALDAGTWGNSLVAEITASAAFPSTGFNLIVKDAAGTILETFEDLLLDPVSNDYVEKRINDVSTLITALDLGSTNADPLPIVGEAVLASGVDGTTTLTSANFTDALVDLDPYPVAFVAIPGETEEAVALAITAYAEGRKDCVAILEVPQGSDVAAMVAYRDTLAINSSYAAIYGPWLLTTDPITARKIVTPPAGVVAGIYARNDAQGAVWTAPAGVNRGTLRNVLEPETRLSKGHRDTLQGKQINPIAVVSGALAVYGQRTLQIKASATDRVNVRRLMAYIEKSVVDAAQFIIFEANDPRTWNSFLRTVVPFLERVKSRGGVEDFRVVCDATINTPAVVSANIMKARVQVIPTKTAEFIDVEFSIAPSGADFAEL